MPCFLPLFFFFLLCCNCSSHHSPSSPYSCYSMLPSSSSSHCTYSLHCSAVNPGSTISKVLSSTSGCSIESFISSSSLLATSSSSSPSLLSSSSTSVGT